LTVNIQSEGRGIPKPRPKDVFLRSADLSKNEALIVEIGEGYLTLIKAKLGFGVQQNT